MASFTRWCSVLLLGYKPVQHVTVLNTVGNCNTMVSIIILWDHRRIRGPGSSVGIVTGYELDGPGIECRWGSRFSAPVQTGPGAHPASCTMGTGSFPGVKSGRGVTLTPHPGVKSGRGVTLTPHPLLVPWSKKRRAIPLLPVWAVRPVQNLSALTRVHLYLFYRRICCPSLTEKSFCGANLYCESDLTFGFVTRDGFVVWRG